MKTIRSKKHFFTNRMFGIKIGLNNCCFILQVFIIIFLLCFFSVCLFFSINSIIFVCLVLVLVCFDKIEFEATASYNISPGKKRKMQFLLVKVFIKIFFVLNHHQIYLSFTIFALLCMKCLRILLFSIYVDGELLAKALK